MKRLLHFGGVILFTWGILFIVLPIPRITGFVIAPNGDWWAISVLGLAFMFCGIMLLMSGREEESALVSKSVKVYDSSKSKNKDHNTCYILQQNNGYRVTLGEFKREIAQLERDSQGKELVALLREEYLEPLKMIVNGGLTTETGIAWSFLEALGEHRQQLPQQYRLPPAEHQQIVTIFKDWDGTLTPQQSALLHKYGLSFEKGKTTNVIYFPYRKSQVRVSKTPSDKNAGSAVSHDIIHLIEHLRSRQSNN